MPEDISDSQAPLAERMRPRNLDQFLGQADAVGRGSLIRHAVEHDQVFSMILWGPPGCGKTTLARIIARATQAYFVHFSAVLSGVKQIRAVIDEAREQRERHQRATLLFVDEIHRFNKAQQDAFLHHVESGLITLMGATTENPSFEVIPALMSRCRVIVLKALSVDDLVEILRRALADDVRGLGELGLRAAPEALTQLAVLADGDARAALSGLEAAAALAVQAPPEPSVDSSPELTLDHLKRALQKKALRYDKGGEEHYNLISALHKSLRDSDPDGALYWLGRMLESGEDPVYVTRRMIRFASEDVGLADPFALDLAVSALEALRCIGMPEAELALAQAAVYLATAPKSNALYSAYGQVKKTIRETGSLPVPLHLRNAPTQLMRKLGYGAGYRYAHDHAQGVVAQRHLPEALEERRFYRPTQRGFEKTIAQRLVYWEELKRKKYQE
ncbi:MAG: replication-associated recombination protein A [Desulfobacterales bacterium]